MLARECKSIAAKRIQFRSMWVILCLNLPSWEWDHLYPGILASGAGVLDPAGRPCWMLVPPSYGQHGLWVTKTGEQECIRASSL